MSDALLLDTHAWLWYAEGCEGQLSATMLAAIDQARQAHRLHVSAISVWEIGMLCAKEKMGLRERVWVIFVMKPPECLAGSGFSRKSIPIQV